MSGGKTFTVQILDPRIDPTLFDAVVAPRHDGLEGPNVIRTLGALIQQHPERTPEALNALVISRNLERVGDHATNIAEDVIFWVSGADVRHHFAANAAAAAAADEAGR